MYYVYVIRSLVVPQELYIGYTKDMHARINMHNSGKSPHTSKFKPWELIVYLCFANQGAALAFEQYLKSGTGRALIAKRFLINKINFY